jgi:RNA polymerase sigma-70 factor (ECF subfamily)
LQLLPAEERQMLILSKYQGLKYTEVAEIMEISEAAVKTRVHRALKMLRTIFFSKPIKPVL